MVEIVDLDRAAEGHPVAAQFDIITIDRSLFVAPVHTVVPANPSAAIIRSEA
jgi:hypothetical protein